MEDLTQSIFPDRIYYATFWQRFAALFIDYMVLAIPDYIIGRLSGGGNIISDYFLLHEVTLPTIYNEVSSTAIAWLYFAIQESGPQQATLGKRALNIKVTDLAGNRISFGRATGRYFAKALSDLILGIGYLMMLWDKRSQALHDRLAGTLVVKKIPQV
jgi:uncharacterized RDD family membrane protein YckC